MTTTTAQLAAPTRMTGSQAPTHRGLAGWIKALVSRYRKTMERRASVAALRSMDNHLLKDIGLDRSEIVSMVYGHGKDGTRRARA